MTEFLKMDVFFFIATVAISLFAIAFTIASIYVIGILRDLKYVSEKIRTGADNLSEDISSLRENVQNQGLKLKHAFLFFSKIFYRKNKHEKQSTREGK